MFREIVRLDLFTRGIVQREFNWRSFVDVVCDSYRDLVDAPTFLWKFLTAGMNRLGEEDFGELILLRPKEGEIDINAVVLRGDLAEFT